MLGLGGQGVVKEEEEGAAGRLPVVDGCALCELLGLWWCVSVEEERRMPPYHVFPF